MFRDGRFGKVPTELHCSGISLSKWVPGRFQNHHFLNTESNAPLRAATAATVHRLQVQQKQVHHQKQLLISISQYNGGSRGVLTQGTVIASLIRWIFHKVYQMSDFFHPVPPARQSRQ